MDSDLHQNTKIMEDEDINTPLALGMPETVLSDSKCDSEVLPINDIIDYLVNNTSLCFKSQQIGESDLSTQEKKNIALELYKKGKLFFLNKFGIYLTEAHLSYFQNSTVEDNELKVIVDHLHKLLHDNKRTIITKNRRFGALTKMLKENSYFSEIEMMKRNPLLYEQLVGQYLTEKEKVERDKIDTENITLLGVLLESMERRQTKEVLDKQRKSYEPDECRTEDNSSDESTNDESERARASHWGEFEKPKNSPRRRRKPKAKSQPKTEFVTATERTLLREEFVQEMYRSFLAGEDDAIDYESIDSNVDFDSLDVRGRDEEERYFDSETPEEVEMELEVSAKNENSHIVENEESEDELEIYMKHLNNHPTLKNVSQV